MNLDNKLTTNRMLDLLAMRYRRLLTKLLYMFSSTFLEDTSLPNFKHSKILFSQGHIRQFSVLILKVLG